MRQILGLLLLTLMPWIILSCSDKSQEPPPLDTIDKQFSYTMGYEAVGVMENFEAATLDKQAFLNGIKDALDQKAPRLSRDQGLHVKNLVFDKEREHKNQQIMLTADENRERQEKFLAENKTREGIHTTDSGLQYEILKKGDGPRPTPADKIRVHLKGMLLDGTVFDSSYADGIPLVGPVKGDIPVWEEALTLMRVGAKYKFFVPSQLAYGEKGTFQQGGNIGPNQMIILELELLGIVNDSEDKS
ncbi:MAG: FKBP-type peptidyl-prolyl cis-trans isomerase N-terminal domain-containing protein [Desulfosudaceae bacterium]